MTEAGSPSTTEIGIVERGDVPGEAVAYARRRLESVIDQIADPVLYARVKLTQAPDPARDRPAVAQVTVDINGDLVRAHVAGHTMLEAIDLLRGRLNAQLEHRHERQKTRHRRPEDSGPGEWRHGDRPTERPRHFDRPVDERQLVQHKSYVIDDVTPDEAAFDMEQLDFDFYLFRELATGQDALIERTEDGGYRLNRADGSTTDPGPTAIALSVAEHPAPVLDLDQARDHLAVGGGPFVFFLDADSGRGRVLYLRYDGHYGLVAPEEPT